MRKLFLIIGTFATTLCYAQQLNKGIEYAVESRAIWSDGKTFAPLWLTANQHGLISAKSSSGILKAGIFRSNETDSLKNWKHAYGLELATGWNHTSSFIVQQAYYDLSYRWMQVSIGSKERASELKNALLSSGGMTFGINARPIPQVRLEIPDYVAIPGTKEWFHLKGHLAYGMYTDNQWQKDFVASGRRYTQNVLHHSKALFFKIGNEKKTPLVYKLGLEMATQFGGTAYNVSYGRGETKKENFKMGHGLKDFWHALVPFGSGGDPTDGEGYANVSGNMLGSLHGSLEYHFKKWKIRAYCEHFFEDHSMIIDQFAWNEYRDNFGKDGFKSYIPPLIPGAYYWKDGLYGIELSLPHNRWMNEILYEYLGTKEQSGPVYHDYTEQIADQISGIDNYYNHNIYTGWQHWGMSMGTPFLPSPIYNTDGTIQFKNNRVKTHHLGLAGNPIKELSYRILISHSKYWGTYHKPLIDTREKTSALLELTYEPTSWKGWELKGAFAFDNGDFPGNSVGGSIGIRKIGLLNF